jgi:hypothetical protein
MSFRPGLSAAVFAVALVSAFGVAAQEFPDPMPAAGVSGAALNAAFRPLGVTFETPPGQPLVALDTHTVYGGDAVAGARADIVLVQQGGHPCQYTMELDTPQIRVVFNRSQLIAGPSGVTHPVWNATAQDADGATLSSVSEGEIRSYVNVPSRRFTLTGPGIKRIVFWGDDKGVDGFCNVVIDTVDMLAP